MPKKICLSWKSRIIFRSFSVFISEQASDCRRGELGKPAAGYFRWKRKRKKENWARKYINVINSAKNWVGWSREMAVRGFKATRLLFVCFSRSSLNYYETLERAVSSGEKGREKCFRNDKISNYGDVYANVTFRSGVRLIEWTVFEWNSMLWGL